MSKHPKAAYEELIAAGVRALADDEFWCIYHPDGALEDTASKRIDDPVRIICDALNADWDDLVQQGYCFGRLKRAPTRPLDDNTGER
jgi:hypothetical protein